MNSFFKLAKKNNTEKILNIPNQIINENNQTNNDIYQPKINKKNTFTVLNKEDNTQENKNTSEANMQIMLNQITEEKKKLENFKGDILMMIQNLFSANDKKNEPKVIDNLKDQFTKDTFKFGFDSEASVLDQSTAKTDTRIMGCLMSREAIDLSTTSQKIITENVTKIGLNQSEGLNKEQMNTPFSSQSSIMHTLIDNKSSAKEVESQKQNLDRCNLLDQSYPENNLDELNYSICYGEAIDIDSDSE